MFSSTLNTHLKWFMTSKHAWSLYTSMTVVLTNMMDSCTQSLHLKWFMTTSTPDKVYIHDIISVYAKNNCRYFYLPFHIHRGMHNLREFYSMTIIMIFIISKNMLLCTWQSCYSNILAPHTMPFSWHILQSLSLLKTQWQLTQWYSCIICIQQLW